MHTNIHTYCTIVEHKQNSTQAKAVTPPRISECILFISIVFKLGIICCCSGFATSVAGLLEPSHQVLKYCPLISKEMAITEQLPCAEVPFRVTLVNETPHNRYYSIYVRLRSQIQLICPFYSQVDKF